MSDPIIIPAVGCEEQQFVKKSFIRHTSDVMTELSGLLPSPLESDFDIGFKSTGSTSVQSIGFRLFDVVPDDVNATGHNLEIKYLPASGNSKATISVNRSGVEGDKYPIPSDEDIVVRRLGDTIWIMVGGVSLTALGPIFTTTAHLIVHSTFIQIDNLYVSSATGTGYVDTLTPDSVFTATYVMGCDAPEEVLYDDSICSELCVTEGVCIKHIERVVPISVGTLDCNSTLEMCPNTFSISPNADRDGEFVLVYTDNSRGYISVGIEESVKNKIMTSNPIDCGLPIRSFSGETDESAFIEERNASSKSYNFCTFVINQTINARPSLRFYTNSFGTSILAASLTLDSPSMLSNSYMSVCNTSCLSESCGPITGRNPCIVNVTGTDVEAMTGAPISGNFSVSFTTSLYYTVGIGTSGTNETVPTLMSISSGSGTEYSTSPVVTIVGGFQRILSQIPLGVKITINRNGKVVSLYVAGTKQLSIIEEPENTYIYLRTTELHPGNPNIHTSGVTDIRLNGEAIEDWTVTAGQISVIKDACGPVVPGSSSATTSVVTSDSTGCESGDLTYTHSKHTISLGEAYKVFSMKNGANIGTIDLVINNLGGSESLVTVYISRVTRLMDKNIVYSNIAIKPNESFVITAMPIVARERVLVVSSRDGVRVSVQAMIE